MIVRPRISTGGCCADINAIAEHNGVAHLFKQSSGVDVG
jgi:hypothetical protein